MKQLITMKDYLTSSGKYPEREAMADEQVILNATLLIEKTNALLHDLGVTKILGVSSGFRPQDVNKKVKGAAKKSAHILGLAVDLVDDKEQTLGKLLISKPELLKKHGVWIEHLDHTKGQFTNWAHCDLVKRSDRELQVFRP